MPWTSPIRRKPRVPIDVFKNILSKINHLFESLIFLENHFFHSYFSLFYKNQYFTVKSYTEVHILNIIHPYIIVF